MLGGDGRRGIIEIVRGDLAMGMITDNKFGNEVSE